MSANAIALALAATVALGMVAFMIWWMGSSARGVAAGLAEERERSWHATVTRSETQEMAYQGSGTLGASRKLKHLTAYYNRDDGVEGNVQAYENDALRGTFIGALAYYKEAPGWDELSRWKEGDRLFKPVGEIFPQRERP